MSVISGTDLGRCFLAGKDGSLYEAAYRAEEGWFSRKCRKINHSTSSLSFLVPSFFSMSDDDSIIQIEVDNSRKILYTRSEKGTIDVYDLGENGDEMYKVASKTLSSITQQANCIARTVDSSNFKPIIGISAIAESESAVINLMAVTESGVRLYFSTSSGSRITQRPTFLNLIHVRLPPGFSASSNQRPTRVHIAQHQKATSLLMSSINEDKDALWVLNNDFFPFEGKLMEVPSAMTLTGRVWKMTEEVKTPLVNKRNYINFPQFDRPILSDTPSVISEDLEEQRKFIFLSSSGAHIANKPQPVDHLKQILQDNQGFDNDAVKGFFQIYKETQACAIALSLACNNTDKLVGEWASLAFFKYGGEAQMIWNRGLIPFPSSPQQVSTPIHSNQASFTGFASSPISSYPGQSASFISPLMSPGHHQAPVQQAEPTTEFSHRHNGVFLYFTRIVRPVWSHNVVSVKMVSVADKGPQELLQSSLPINELSFYIEKLSSLKNFLSTKIPYTTNESQSRTPPNRDLNTTSTAQLQERASMNNLIQLINSCLEVFGLWQILQSHEFHSITQNIPPELVMQLKNLTFKDVIVGGGEVCARMASALVHKFIADNATTDAISRRLNEACPSIFKQENALHAKAHEMLVKARSMTKFEEKNRCVEEAAQLLKRVGSRINLPEACGLLQAVHSYSNLVDLCISTAIQRDPQNYGVQFYRNGEPAEDHQGRTAFSARQDCYSTLLQALEKLTQQSQNPVQPKTALAQTGDNSQLPDGVSSLSNEEANQQADFVLNRAIESNDELLHVALYDWLYQNRQNDRLLQIKSPFLETYLKRKTSTFTDSVVLMDLLWMFYERNGHYRAAAEILNKLAERHGTDIDLYHRLEYLSRAIMCMKSSQTPISTSPVDAKPSGEFLHELEEKMQVAGIQLQLLETIQRQGDGPRVSEAKACLNSDLFNVTRLYEIADTFKLPEIQLAIVSAANHYDPALIELFWQKIFERVLNDTANQPTEAFKAILGKKLESLGKSYASSEKYFPLGNLC